MLTSSDLMYVVRALEYPLTLSVVFHDVLIVTDELGLVNYPISNFGSCVELDASKPQNVMSTLVRLPPGFWILAKSRFVIERIMLVVIHTKYMHLTKNLTDALITSIPQSKSQAQMPPPLCPISHREAYPCRLVRATV